VPAGAQFHAIGKIVVACDKEDIDSGMPATLPFLQQLSYLFGAVPGTTFRPAAQG